MEARRCARCKKTIVERSFSGKSEHLDIIHGLTSSPMTGGPSLTERNKDKALRNVPRLKHRADTASFPRETARSNSHNLRIHDRKGICP